MREIKFRGRDYRTESDTWYFGSLIKKDNYCVITWDEGDCIKRKIVDEETVGQYTGLKDKGGTEIYEGDVVRLGVFPGFFYEVQYDEEHCGFCLYAEPIGRVSLGRDDERDLLVIGNIHENPELLKEIKEG